MWKRIPFQYRITVMYILLGAVWILFSDQVLLWFTQDPYQIQWYSTYKGWFYVLITGIFLFYLVRGEIRHQRQLYNDMLEAKRKAEEADRLKTAFLSNLSHYIRTPMNSILGFIELLEDKDNSEATQKLFMSYIQESSDNLLQTLNSIIEIAMIQEGQATVKNDTVHVNKLIDRVAETTRMDLSNAKSQVEVITRYGWPDGDDIIYSDQDRLLLILSTLTSNSARFTDRGEVEIGYEAEKLTVRFWIRDTGHGIPPEKQGGLFNGIFQQNYTTSTKGEGAGLGLALASGLTGLLGGKLWLEQTGPEGTTLCLTIPIIPGNRQVEE